VKQLQAQGGNLHAVYHPSKADDVVLAL
jgi:hypothetical protein